MLGTELVSAPVGLLAAFFLATSFWHLIFSRIAFRAIAAPLFLVWAIYLLLIGLRRRNVVCMILAGLIYGLGFYTYPAYRITLVLVIAIFVAERRPGSGRIACIFLATTAAVIAPLAFYFAAHPDAFWGISGIGV